MAGQVTSYLKVRNALQLRGFQPVLSVNTCREHALVEKVKSRAIESLKVRSKYLVVKWCDGKKLKIRRSGIIHVFAQIFESEDFGRLPSIHARTSLDIGKTYIFATPCNLCKKK